MTFYGQEKSHCEHVVLGPGPHSGSGSLEGPSHCRRAAFVITKRIKEYKYELHAPQQVACEVPTHAHTHTERNICAGYVKTFIVVCRMLERRRKKERGQRKQMPNMACHMPHSHASPNPHAAASGASAANAQLPGQQFLLVRMRAKQ